MHPNTHGGIRSTNGVTWLHKTCSGVLNSKTLEGIWFSKWTAMTTTLSQWRPSTFAPINNACAISRMCRVFFFFFVWLLHSVVEFDYMMIHGKDRSVESIPGNINLHTLPHYQIISD